ncbi:quinoprotein dehydrogenase-associated SoxYZ-like carrier [Azospirillum sp.]|uniref:quinoprotein dehydrogenase-associated SoxYZ-like carrier n=1 Tax=Azospirillum sp. TaxID=34012 RepID=UPI003D745B65
MLRPPLPCLAATALLTTLLATAPAMADDSRWDYIREQLYGDRPIAPAGDRLVLETPTRAEDAAIVPVSFSARAPQSGPDGIREIRLIIDNNPAPSAGVFTFPADGAAPAIATRIRINEYTPVRVVAETNDGRLLMSERFVKAAGGCSAPAGKDQMAALARLGRMKLNGVEEVRVGEPARLQLLISHPNNSGLQFDQVSRTYIPPHYITTLDVTYNGRPVLGLTGDISISEDPSIHFTFTPPEPGVLEVRAVDTKGAVYTGRWTIGPTNG